MHNELEFWESRRDRGIVVNDIFGVIHANRRIAPERRFTQDGSHSHRIHPSMHISVLAFDGLFDTGLAVTLDPLRTANNLAAGLGISGPRFDVDVVGVRRRVRTANGMTVPVKPITHGRKPDWVIVPALGATTAATLVPALARADVRDGLLQIRQWHAQGVKIAAACIGTFVLAEAGLLDGQEATTTWSVSPLFRQRYPQVHLDESRMLVPSSVGITAGAALGHMDLALWLIRQASPELSSLVSRYLLADLRSSQAAYIVPNHLAQADPLVARFERWSREHLQSGFSLGDAADALATSPRTLQRRCEAVLGKSPLAYFQDLRVERARALLQAGDRDVEAIATEVGYADGATLRTLLRRRLGRGVRELRDALR